MMPDEGVELWTMFCTAALMEISKFLSLYIERIKFKTMVLHRSRVPRAVGVRRTSAVDRWAARDSHSHCRMLSQLRGTSCDNSQWSIPGYLLLQPGGRKCCLEHRQQQPMCRWVSNNCLSDVRVSTVWWSIVSESRAREVYHSYLLSSIPPLRSYTSRSSPSLLHLLFLHLSFLRLPFPPLLRLPFPPLLRLLFLHSSASHSLYSSVLVVILTAIQLPMWTIDTAVSQVQLSIFLAAMCALDDLTNLYPLEPLEFFPHFEFYPPFQNVIIRCLTGQAMADHTGGVLHMSSVGISVRTMQLWWLSMFYSCTCNDVLWGTGRTVGVDRRSR